MEKSCGPLPHTGVLRFLALYYVVGEGNELSYLLHIDRVGTYHIDLVLNPRLVGKIVSFRGMLLVERFLRTVHEVLYQVVDDR